MEKRKDLPARYATQEEIEAQKEYDADQRRYKKAKEIKEDASIEVINTESEENENGK